MYNWNQYQRNTATNYQSPYDYQSGNGFNYGRYNPYDHYSGYVSDFERVLNRVADNYDRLPGWVQEYVVPVFFAEKDGVISYEIDRSNPDKGLYGTLDIGDDGSLEARELLSTSTGQFYHEGEDDVDEDGISATINGKGDPLDILNISTYGQFDDRIGIDDNAGESQFQQQLGELRKGNGGLTVDSSGKAANFDGSSAGGNFGDEGTGRRDFNNGEIMRFTIGDDFNGINATMDFNYDGGNDGDDIQVNLYRNGVLVSSTDIDLDATGNTGVSVGSENDLVVSWRTFDTVEIVALLDAQYNLSLLDLDITVESNAPGFSPFTSTPIMDEYAYYF